MTTPFIHLKVHSEYSLSDGLVRIKELVSQAKKMNMPAVGLTDITNFYGLVKFYKAALSEGIKPIFGSDFIVRSGEDESQTFPLTLLVVNEIGYRNITELISRAYTKGQHLGVATIKQDWLKEHAEGVIALSGGREGHIGQALVADKISLAKERLQWWLSVFPGRFYLELQRTGRENEEVYIHHAVELAEQAHCPVVATNDVRFLDQLQFYAHETRVCICSGRVLDDKKRPKNYSEQQYFRSTEEMQQLFSDIPEAIENTVEIARRCSLFLELGKNFLPAFPIPEGETEGQFFSRISHEGLMERLEFLFDSTSEQFPDIAKRYKDRLDWEINTILDMGFPGYFLIVMDFIQWAKTHNIPVGPGRGSGAGSLVAYALKITDLDPLEYDLLFERFLNPERVSMPDFDVDFCTEGRDKVIDYVAETYGREAVSQIITFGTMASKAVVRDVARVQGKSYGLADKLSKLIPFRQGGISLDDARKEEERLDNLLNDDEEASEIWEMSKRLEGITRNVGKHAGGVVIAPTKLTDFSPLYIDDSGNGSLVTQYDKDDVEQVGLVKFDFLGLRNLTIIKWALEIINRRRQGQGEEALEIERIPLDDEKTFTLLQQAETTAVFQLESTGMKGLIAKLKPSRFEDIIALVALYRPGPLESGMVDDFIARKHGQQVVAYPHADYQSDDLKPVLESTYGIILYQEQVMQIAQVMGGYSLGGADLLRRAMGKKKAEEMAKQREYFMEGAIAKGHDKKLAGNIFDLMEKFAGYGFNKSHSAAYALVAYQTAWLKAHYPAEFMAASMSSVMHDTDKVVSLIEECRAMDLSIEPPSVNIGEYAFSVNNQGSIVYGLGAVKGLGEGPIENLIQTRNDSGDFTDLFDFCNRTDAKKINRRALEALIRSGAFDSLNTPRHILSSCMVQAVKSAEQSAKNADAGMVDLFGEPSLVDDEQNPYQQWEHVRPWSEKERLRGERETLGLYLSGHPFDEYSLEIGSLIRRRISNVGIGRETQRIAGWVVSVREIKTQRGSMAALVLDDRTDRIEVTIFSKIYNEYYDIIKKDTALIIDGTVIEDERAAAGKSLRAKSVKTINTLRKEYARELLLTLYAEQDAQRLCEKKLKGLLEPVKTDNGVSVVIAYHRQDVQGRIALGPEWAVEPSDELLQRLKEELGNDNVQLVYR